MSFGVGSPFGFPGGGFGRSPFGGGGFGSPFGGGLNGLGGGIGGGGSFGAFLANNPIQDPSLQQANYETNLVRANLPGPLADDLGLSLDISNYCAFAPDPTHQLAFQQARQVLNPIQFPQIGGQFDPTSQQAGLGGLGGGGLGGLGGGFPGMGGGGGLGGILQMLMPLLSMLGGGRGLGGLRGLA